MFTLTLPWPPSLNHYWRTVMVRQKNSALLAKQGFRTNRTQVILGVAGKNYRQEAVVLARRAMWDQRIGNDFPFKGDVSVRVVVYPPDQRTRDLDNLPKAMFDAMTYALVWTDDNQVARYSVERAETARPGRVVLEIDGMPPKA